MPPARLLRGPISRLRCSPYGSTAALLDATSARSLRRSDGIFCWRRLMANRQLTSEELERANTVLMEIRAKLESLSEGDKELLFAYRRKIYKELTYDERSKPMARRKLKDQKWKEQRGLCAICGKELPERYTVLDRLLAVEGYTSANTRLIHAECDVQNQASNGYS